LAPKITKQYFGFEIFCHSNISKKSALKMLMKLTPGVNFINILPLHFWYKNELSSFSIITFGSANSWHQNIGKKCVCKMLMKLTHERHRFSDQPCTKHEPERVSSGWSQNTTRTSNRILLR